MLAHHAFASSRRLTQACAALLLAATSLAACSSDDGSPGGGGSGGSAGTPVEQVGGLLAVALCDTFKQCLGPIFDIGLGAQCKEEFTKQFEEGDLPTLKASIAKGTVSYDGTKADACIAEIKALGCAAATTRLGGACTVLVAGKVALGGECTSNNECTGDAYCKVDAACPGKCTAREGDGGACKSDDACQSGMSCTGGKCTKPLAAGESCTSGASCSLGNFCVGADESKGTPGTCKAATDVFTAAAGASCDLSKMQLCALPQVCALDSATATGATFKCVEPSAAGATCKIAALSACVEGHFCDGIDAKAGKFEGTCKPLPKAGEPCSEQAGGSGCASGLVCGTDKKCKERGKNTAACGSDSECYSERCVSGACVPKDACNTKP